MSLKEPLTEAFAEDLPETVSENLRKATVRDLLTMCLGQEQASLMGICSGQEMRIPTGLMESIANGLLCLRSCIRSCEFVCILWRTPPFALW